LGQVIAGGAWLRNPVLSLLPQTSPAREFVLMRTITGWRFFVYVAVPLIIATFGAANLAYDLLRDVEDGSAVLERSRNQTLLTESLNAVESDLARLAADNARWDEAVANTTGTPNTKWFDTSLGSAMSLGVSYDIVAILDGSSGEILVGRTRSGALAAKADLLGERKISEFEGLLDPSNFRHGVVSGFFQTADGPKAVAFAPVASSKTAPGGNGRLIYFARKLDGGWIDSQRRSLLIDGLSISAPDSASGDKIALKGPDGQVALQLSWRSEDIGKEVTKSSWVKAGLVLSFLVLVMTSIGFVCWRLVQQLVADEGKAQHQALHDHLTSLPNRLALTKRMRELQINKEFYALAFADLDGFKEVNDSHGHEFGDRLLLMIADGIRKLAIGSELNCRLGGDEFVVLFIGTGATQKAKEFSSNLITMLKQPFDLDGRLASVGASIGIAECGGHHDVTEMLRRSDIAMYKAKTTGKNRYCVFDASFDHERNENLAIAAELKTIIAARSLEIMFQPKVSAATHEITGLEALARWPATSFRNVSADKFISIAETSGLIDQLGELILEKACQAAARWPNTRVAVNISAVQLNNPSFVRSSLAVLHQFGIEPNRMEFEITETSLINDTERAKQVFKALQQSGIKVALDDFGTGFSSIGYLRTFQFDRIKIDKSIINKVLTSPSELAVVQGTLLVARGLAAEVTAEGVEDEEQAKVLRLAGCTEFQGYVFYKPLNIVDATELLKTSKVAKTPRTEVA
jgi:diguanylate cyclase (GGDEF)-like protein